MPDACMHLKLCSKNVFEDKHEGETAWRVSYTGYFKGLPLKIVGGNIPHDQNNIIIIPPHLLKLY